MYAHICCALCSDSELWKTDTSGDPDNALFGTLFAKDVPKFKRARRGAFLLGGRGEHLSGEIVRVLLSRSAVPISLYTDRKFRVISRYAFLGGASFRSVLSALRRRIYCHFSLSIL